MLMVPVGRSYPVASSWSSELDGWGGAWVIEAEKDMFEKVPPPFDYFKIAALTIGWSPRGR